MKYRKKPIVIEAVQWKGNNHIEIAAMGLPKQELQEDFLSDYLVIPTMEGEMRANRGDWIIKGVKGEFYPIKDEIFQLTYEPVTD